MIRKHYVLPNMRVSPAVFLGFYILAPNFLPNRIVNRQIATTLASSHASLIAADEGCDIRAEVSVVTVDLHCASSTVPNCRI
jgi:hypothetical protein